MYFVTICTHGRELVFGEVVKGKIVVNEYGRVICACWEGISHHFRHVEVDTFVLMPNHLHGIVAIVDTPMGRGEAFADGNWCISPDLPANASPLLPHGTQAGSLGAVVQNFKSISTRKINQIRGTPGAPLCNAITTNTSFATKRPCVVSATTS